MYSFFLVVDDCCVEKKANNKKSDQQFTQYIYDTQKAIEFISFA